MTANSNFVVFTTNRSGSEWVISTLNNFKNVTAHGELFLPRPRLLTGKWDEEFAYKRYFETKFKPWMIRPFSVFSYLNGLYSLPGKVGFKLMYKQLGLYPEILAYLKTHDVQILHLVRSNHLDVMLSYAVKAKLGQAHLLVGQSAPDQMQVELDANNLVKQVAWLQKQQNMARRVLKFFRLPYLEVVYEEMTQNQDHYFEMISKFLSIPSDDGMPKSPLTRIRKGTHRDMISNYDQVKQALSGSQFASLLD